MTKRKEKSVPLGRALQEAILNDPAVAKTPWYRRLFKSRLDAKPHRIGKYKLPFQGEKEMARRRQQIEKGFMKL